MTVEFTAFPKIGRLKRNIVVTEKLDGTNAAVRIVRGSPEDANYTAIVGEFVLYAQSRNRFITPASDNYGFATWVANHAEELVGLGEGIHYGEWWGAGIQRRYGLTEKRFSLFNVDRWAAGGVPPCCGVVPVLYEGLFDLAKINGTMTYLGAMGSVAAPGFMKPEGIVVFHKGINQMFKMTFEHDENGKEAAA